MTPAFSGLRMLDARDLREQSGTLCGGDMTARERLTNNKTSSSEQQGERRV